ncbi:FAD/NAD(P)-binding domain-containing protein [Aureobasidium pullulans]|uniref:FAD/NAD(P)-binding domain-containing protein n=1 Tax=Aureobasidium pullulans TaxID=5580 RepID=A0A4V4HZ09_AURPU|nr:FAD/NAD(P)-binding domain-containing protein [Aureobasidium pullulans]
MAPGSIRRVAVIGAGPSGAITLDALAREEAFDQIRVFDRQEGPGGCWYGDKNPPVPLTNLAALATRTADQPLELPVQVPGRVKKNGQPRWTDSSIYPYLETNVDVVTMEYTQEPISGELSARTIELHGENSPFRHWTIMRDYVTSLFQRKGYEDLVSYNTHVERVEKVGDEWKVTLRKEEGDEDYWWVEHFDAVIVASGHFNVPYVPAVRGLEELERQHPGSVLHSKMYRGREAYQGKRVVVVGGSVSAADISTDLVGVVDSKVYAVVNGHTINVYFGDGAFNNPGVSRKPTISHIDTSDGRRTVHFIDGTFVENVDNIIFGTGYSWSLPFLPDVKIRNNRVPGLYQNVVYQQDPTLLFVGAVGAGLTFKIFEWQAVLAARLLAGRAELPSLEEQQRWEEERIKKKGDGPAFNVIHPDFEEYFETVRSLAGPGEDGKGRPLPPYKPEWFQAFMDGHELRKQMWARKNAAAAAATTESTKARI